MGNGVAQRYAAPSLQDWIGQLDKLRRKGSEWVGPCPMCAAGKDRFHVKQGDTRVLVGCRVCEPRDPSGRDTWFGDLAQRVFGDNGWEPPDPEEQKRREEAEEKRRAEEAKQHARVAVKARDIWETAKPATSEHPYLKRKKIRGELPGLRIADGALLVPMVAYDADGKGQCVNLQRIFSDGNKRPLKGGRVNGTWRAVAVPMGFKDRADKTIYICEGWATAYSIWKATGDLAVIAFWTHGLRTVAKLLRAKYPDARIIVAADNDRWSKEGSTFQNPGVMYAREAAREINAEVAIPDFKDLTGKPTDFDDLRLREGKKAVRKWLDPKQASWAVTGLEAPSENGTEPAKETEPAKARKPLFHRLADNQLAGLLSGDARKRLVFDPTRGWFVAPSGRWDWTQEKAVGTLHKALHKLAVKDAEEAGGELLLGNPTIQGAITFVKYDVEDSPPWDGNPMLAGLPGGGVLDLAIGTARESRREDFVSRRLGVRPDPDAPPPERFLGLIHDMMADPETSEWLLSWLGYVITGHTIVTDNSVPFLIGDAGSGKTTLCNLLGYLLGGSNDAGYAAKLPPDVIVERPRSREKHLQWMVKCLNGPRLAIGTEVPERSRLDAGAFKDLTGGEEGITANLMRRDSITFQPTAKLLFYGNTVPSMPGWDPGLQRRIVITNCTGKPEAERDECLPDALRTEAPAILHYLADRAAQGYERHLENGHWLPAPSRLSEEATSTVLREHDVLGEAIRGTISFTGSDLATITPGDLRHALKKWYESEGHNPEKLPSVQAIGSELRAEAKRQKSWIRKGKRHGRPWLGIGLASA